MEWNKRNKDEKQSKQRRIDKYQLPLPTEAEHKAANKKLALFFYDTATPFSRIEHPMLLEAFEAYRPGAKLMNQKRLSSDQLDEFYWIIKNHINKITGSIEYYSTLLTDGWKKTNRESIIGYCSSSSTESIFLESISTTSQSYTEEFIATDIKRVLAEHPYIAGLCTDNAPANKFAWARVATDYPDLFYYGCQSHALNLLVKDLFVTESTDSNYPFTDIKSIVQSCIEISQFFSTHPPQFAKYKEINLNANKFRLPCITRLGSISACLENIEKQYQTIVMFVSNGIWRGEGSRDLKEKKEKIFQSCSNLNHQKLISVIK